MNFSMIKNFKCKDTERVFYKEMTYKWPKELKILARRKLILIDSLESLMSLKRLPGNRLKKLKGNIKNYYSLRINRQWRIIFKWYKYNAYNVRIIDYH